MLVIWSSAKLEEIRKTIGAVVSEHEVEHRIYSDTSSPPDAEPGDVILACGAKALEVLIDHELVPKKRTVGSMREKLIKTDGVTIFVTYDPGLTYRDYARLPDVQWDTQLAIRVLKTGSPRPEIGTYRYVESLHELILRIEEKYEQTGKPVEVACDLETKGLDEYDPKAWIIACSFTVDEGKSDVLYFEEGETLTAPTPFASEDEWEYWEGLWVQVHWILTTEKVSIRGANFKFDSRWMNHKWGIYCTNHRFDTLLAGSLLDENKSNSLKLHAKMHTTMGGYEDDMDKYDMGNLQDVPKDELLNYVGGDTDATYRVAKHFRRELLKNKRLSNFYVKLVHPASKAFEKLERNGICVDQEYYQRLRTDLEAEKDRLEQAMVDMLPAKLRAKHHDKITDNFADGKNPLTAAILTDFLFTSNGLGLKPQMFTDKTKAPSTSIDHLMMFEDNEVAQEFVGLFKEYGSATKTLSTYVIGFLKHLRSDGRFHPHVMLFRGGYGDDGDDSGTVTGRTSMKDPAAQTIPKHTKWTKRLRRAFIAPKGKIILNLDFSQGELRIAAVLAEEPTMMEAYASGADLHAITAAQLTGYEMGEFMLLPEELRDELRSNGKAGNFGLLYGMGAPGFREYARTSYGVAMSEEDAFNKREAFFNLYWRLPEWHEEQRSFAHMNGYVVSPLGRVRHLPLINGRDREVVAKQERQAINSPVQSCLSDMMQLAMVLIDAQYGHEDIEMFLMTHDSLSLYVPEEDATMWAKRLKAVMESLPLKREFGWDSPLAFPADAEVSVPDEEGVHSLAFTKKLKGL